MTYTFKLSRRLARLRTAACVTLLTLAGGCDGGDRLGPEEPAPAGAPESPALASASFSGGIPFGIFALPLTEFGARYNGAMRNIAPGLLTDELAAIKGRGGKVVLMFAGNERYYKDASGHFSLTKWKERIDRYRTVNFGAYVTDGTVVAHYLIDEPNDPANWNGQPVPPATLEEMARYSKSIWPNLVTVVRVEPSYLASDHRYLDAAWAQYLERKGSADDYLRRNVADAQARGVSLIVGMNVLKGGTPNGSRMTASQIQSWGTALLGSSYPCAFISWTWDAGLLTNAGVAAAMDALRAKAESRPTKSCRRSDAAATPPPPPPPTPVSDALPFGLARHPVDDSWTRWTGPVLEAEPSSLVARLERARGAGMAVTVVLAPAARTRNGDGTFSLAKWKAEIDRYRTLSIGSYVSGKTLYLHALVDQPRCSRCWGGKAIDWRTIEEMARYSKSIWPALPTTVRVPPSALAKAGIRWASLDAGWAQYSTPRGDIRTWLAAEVSAARSAGLGVVAGLNLLAAAGPGSAPMSASQIREFGATLAREPAVCALVGWSWDAGLAAQAGIRDALDAVAAAAGGRTAGACVVN